MPCSPPTIPLPAQTMPDMRFPPFPESRSAVGVRGGPLVVLVQRDYPLIFAHETLGFVIPGLVAYQLVRQPPVATVLATSAVSLAAYGVLASGLVLGVVTAL
jgi:hypothetical protein